MFRDTLFLLHIGKGLISAVTLSIVVPQSIGSFLRNRIGDSTGDVPCFSLGIGGTMCLILLTCSLFLLVSIFHFIVCSSIDTPLYWFDPWPNLYHCLLCICRFLAKSHVHTQSFGQRSYIHAGFGKNPHIHAYFCPKFTYILPFAEFDVVGSCRVGCECGRVFLGSDIVCWMLLL